MADALRQWLTNHDWTKSLLDFGSWTKSLLDVGLVLALTYMVLVIISERRTLWVVRGFIVLMLATVVSNSLELKLLSFVLEKLVVGSAVAMAVISGTIRSGRNSAAVSTVRFSRPEARQRDR